MSKPLSDIALLMNRSKLWFKDQKKTWADVEEKIPSLAKHRHYHVKRLKPQGKSCLDLGCGWGRYLREYLNYDPERVVGLDLSLVNLDKCRKIDGVHLVRGDIEELPFREQSFEVVSCISTIQHLPKPKKAMHEISRVLKETNAIALVTWNNYVWIKAVWNRNTRLRLIGYIHDIVGCYLPFFRKERVHRNSGFSVRTIKKILNSEQLKILKLIKLHAHRIDTFVTPDINNSRALCF